MSHVMPNPGMPDAAQRRADYDLIVQTCFAVIQDCGDPQLRMEAARILHGINPIPWREAWPVTWGAE